MRRVIHKTEVVERTTDILCNKCGESLGGDFYLDGEPVDFYGLNETSIKGSYGSPCLVDNCEYTFSLCEKCLEELFKTFKIPVDITDYYEPKEDFCGPVK